MLSINVIAICSLFLSPVDRPASEDVRGRLHEYFRRAEAFGFSGAILVARGEEILLEKGYGLADRRDGVPNRADTAFGIASLDKQFTATAILLLEQDEKLSTSDPVARYLSNVPEDKSGVTIHHLLSHTSGVGNHYRDDFYKKSFEDYLRAVLRKPLRCRPGEKFEYSNSGYDLLVHLIETVSGGRYEDFLATRIFEPVGMSRTGSRRLKLAVDEIARYQDNPRSSLDGPQAWAAGDPVHPFLSLRSTVGDLFRWHQALSQPTILTTASKEKLFKANRQRYAYGWNIGRTNRNTRVIHHGGLGTATGLLAGFYRYTDEDLVVIFFANTLADRTLVGELLAATIADMVFGKPVVFPPDVATIDAGSIQRWVGTYKLESRGRIVIESTGSQLTARATDPDAMALLRFPETGGSGLAWGADEKLRVALAGIDAGDLTPLSEILFRTTNATAFTQRANLMFEGFRKRLGSFRGLKLLHRMETIFEGEPETQLIIQIGFEKGYELLHGFRNPAGRYHVQPYRTGSGKVVFPLVAQSPADFSSWNFRMQTGTTIHFRDSASATGPSLEIRATDRTTVARKQ